MSFPRYPEYKDSGVEWLGEVPGHWEVMALRRCLFEHRQGYYSQSAYVDSGIKLLRITDLRDFGRVDFAQCPHVEDVPELEPFLLRESDFVFARTGGAGTFGLVETLSEPAAYASYLIRFRFTKQAYSPFLRNFFLSSGFQEAVRQNIHGGVNQNIHAEDIKDQFLALPPLPEQTAIAAFLDRETAKIDALVAEQRRLIELLKEKRQAVVSHAVTKGLNPDAPMKDSGIEWLGEVPAHWEVKRLKHAKSNERNAFVDGPFGSNLKSEHFVDGGDVYVIESGFATQGRLDVSELKTITFEHFETVSRSEARCGDIIIAKIGAQFGKSAILPEIDKPAVVSGNSLKLTVDPSGFDVKFINWHLTILKDLGFLDDIVNATAQPALSLGGMNNLPLLVPPPAEQTSIVRFLEQQLDQLDTLTAEAQRTIDLLQERRTALISAAVTGQIDVR